MMYDWITKLRQMPVGEVRLNEPLSRHTTFRIGGLCDAMVLPDSAEQAALALAYAHDQQVPVYVLGAGSNILVADEGYHGLVIKLGGRLKRLEITEDAFVAEAGLPLPVLARKIADAGLGGMAFAAGIPGTVGGAVVMNAGAHGGQMSDVITEIIYCDPSGCQKTMRREEAGFVYRSSSFRHNPQWTILAIKGRLEAANAQSLLDEMAAYSQERLEKQPQGLPCAGSVFKNPPGDKAGRLIEAIGAKGWRSGGAMVSEKHSNFIVNTGNASCHDVLALIARIQEAVQAEFGVVLEREVIFLGE